MKDQLLLGRSPEALKESSVLDFLYFRGNQKGIKEVI